LHIAQQMPLPLIVSCFSKSRLVLTFLVLPFWYLLTRVVPDIFQKSSKTVVCIQKILILILRSGWVINVERAKDRIIRPRDHPHLHGNSRGPKTTFRSIPLGPFPCLYSPPLQPPCTVSNILCACVVCRRFRGPQAFRNVSVMYRRYCKDV